MNKINAVKTKNAMRSLYRLIGFQKMNSPDILINQEKEILKTKLLSLSSVEIKYISLSWDDFYKQESIKEEIDNNLLNKQFEGYLINLN